MKRLDLATRAFLFIATVLLLECALGCNKSPVKTPPATHSAVGTVVDSEGSPLAFGTVEFVSVEDERVQAIGKIQSDGKFTLMTIVDDDVVPGAVDGKHKATFLPSERGQRPHYFSGTFEVRPGENSFKLVYPFTTAER
jgi:hypothetical protein